MPNTGGGAVKIMLFRGGNKTAAAMPNPFAAMQTLAAIGLNKMFTDIVDNFVGKLVDGAQNADKSSLASGLPKK
ncbi:hypothetical protein [Paralysiella testudinis]|jgi:hypothetical protein|uniref:Uncharacterized protein n=1 Tax=Paralysiella testudinis TaxID=2809020 RepID=A0A892ZJX7_9NEIS|nr:hypothetical protein [Paralysiella testudinis]QRQ81854.1 hypothetical protein JQU52_14535 [Paralysiella testudinis]